MDLNGSDVHDGEEGCHSAANACTPRVRAEHGSGRASNIVTRMKLKPRMRNASALCGPLIQTPLVVEKTRRGPAEGYMQQSRAPYTR